MFEEIGRWRPNDHQACALRTASRQAQRRKEPLPIAPLVLAKERIGNELAHGFAQLRNRISALGLSLQFFKLAARGPTKKQGTQSREKRSGRKAHTYAYIDAYTKSSLIL